MPTYEYKAKNLNGEEMSGEYDAVSVDALEFMLREKGYFLVASNRKGQDIGAGLFGGRVTLKDLAVFSRQFAVLINAGVTIVEAVGILREQVGRPKLREVLAEIHEDLQKGRVLSEAMDNYPRHLPGLHDEYDPRRRGERLARHDPRPAGRLLRKRQPHPPEDKSGPVLPGHARYPDRRRGGGC